jgi:hypothetical protein
MMSPRRGHGALLFAVALASAACASDPSGPSADPNENPPTMSEVAGDYHATAFTGGGYDVLALGGSLDMSLDADGTVTGSMLVPAAAAGGEDFQADMAGTYTLTGNALTFHQDADTFVRDATWTWSSGVLSGSWSGSSGSVTVRMEQ